MNDKPNAEDRRAHLGFIEDAITRMANESTTLKAWLVPVVTAAYGYAIISSSWVIALVGIIATVVVGWQAAHYLRQERAYRALYAAAVTARTTTFDMDISPMLQRPTSIQANPTDGTQTPKRLSWGPVVRSWSIGGFFGVIIVGGIVIMIGVMLAQKCL